LNKHYIDEMKCNLPDVILGGVVQDPLTSIGLLKPQTAPSARICRKSF